MKRPFGLILAIAEQTKYATWLSEMLESDTLKILDALKEAGMRLVLDEDDLMTDARNFYVNSQETKLEVVK